MDKEVKSKMVTMKVSERELAELKEISRRENRSVANFLMWLVAEFKKRSGITA